MIEWWTLLVVICDSHSLNVGSKRLLDVPNHASGLRVLERPRDGVDGSGRREARGEPVRLQLLN